MLAEAPAILVALEQSTFAAAIRQSVWLYPAANVGHVVALFLFAGAVTVMDLTLLGVLRAAAPLKVVLGSRRAAIAGLLLMAATGFLLFSAEASHVAMNPVFQVKATLIGAGLLNALLTGPHVRRAFTEPATGGPFPSRVRAAAALSLVIWISVATCGRLIAYF